MTSVQEAAMLYLSLGMSILPMYPNKKPVGKWSVFQNRPPTVREVESWYEQSPDVGVAIICGSVSGGLAVLDVDDLEYSDWLKEHAMGFMAQTWAVETGSGKLHIYLRSKTPCFTGKLNYAGMRRADVRGDSESPERGPSYVGAPPSPYLKVLDGGEEIRGSYRSLAGSPERVATVPNAELAFLRLIETVGRALSPSSNGKGDHKDVPSREGSMRILPPPNDPMDREVLIAEVQGIPNSIMTPKMKRTVLKGADANEGDWERCRKSDGKLDHSDIDYAVVLNFRKAGWDNDKIEKVYAWLPVGEPTYQNASRPNHGLSYLRTTLEAADRSVESAQSTSLDICGLNFQVTKVLWMATEPPKCELTIKGPNGREDPVTMTAHELANERLFKEAVFSSLRFWPEMRPGVKGSDFAKFTHAIGSNAVDKDTPVEATESGYLRSVTLVYLKELLPTIPKDYSTVALGWRDERAGMGYVRPSGLLQRISNSFRGQIPKIDKVWSVMERLGATSEGEHNPDTNKTTALWRIPLEVIDKVG